MGAQYDTRSGGHDSARIAQPGHPHATLRRELCLAFEVHGETAIPDHVREQARTHLPFDSDRLHCHPTLLQLFGDCTRFLETYLLPLPIAIGNVVTEAATMPSQSGRTTITVARTTPAANPAASLELVTGFSLEMTGKDIPGLEEARHAIPAGTKINVTFLGNEDLQMRVAAAKAVKDMGFVPVPHISARRLASQEQLEEFLTALQAVGATEHVFAVGGDPAEPEGPYPDSLSVIKTGLLQKYGVREVSIAGYPEGHPDIASDVLWEHLEAKSAALKEQGLDAVILTQFSFDTEPVMDWIEKVRAKGIATEIRIGTPGPAGIKRLIGFARRFGVGANAMIVKKYGFSLTNLLGTAGPDKFVTELAALVDADTVAAPVKLHFYTFGGLLATAEWARDYSAAQV